MNFIKTGLIVEIIGSQYENLPMGDPKLKNPISFSVRYTDDGEMTLALLKCLNVHGKINRDTLHLYYAQEYNPNRGYSRGTRNILSKLQKGEPVTPRVTDTNGCLMRASPLVLFCQGMDNKEIIHNVREAIYYTHNHERSVCVVFLYIKIMHLFLSKNLVGAGELRRYIASLPLDETVFPQLSLLLFLVVTQPNLTPREFNKLMWGKNYVFHIKAIEALATALFILYTTINKPLRAIEKCIEFGGDVDTVGKVLGEFLGVIYGDEWVPEEWRVIENDKFINQQIELHIKRYMKD